MTRPAEATVRSKRQYGIGDRPLSLVYPSDLYKSSQSRGRLPMLLHPSVYDDSSAGFGQDEKPRIRVNIETEKRDAVPSLADVLQLKHVAYDAPAGRKLAKRELFGMIALVSPFQTVKHPAADARVISIDKQKSDVPSTDGIHKTRLKRDIREDDGIEIPFQAEHHLGVVQSKSVNENIEPGEKREQILRMQKRQAGMIYGAESPVVRATVNGAKAEKNPILKLLRAAAGEKTQKILGLNSKAFDIFPGPLPDEHTNDVKNLARVSTEYPYDSHAEQQLVQEFKGRPHSIDSEYLARQPLIDQFMPKLLTREASGASFMPTYQEPTDVPESSSEVPMTPPMVGPESDEELWMQKQHMNLQGRGLAPGSDLQGRGLTPDFVAPRPFLPPPVGQTADISAPRPGMEQLMYLPSDMYGPPREYQQSMYERPQPIEDMQVIEPQGMVTQRTGPVDYVPQRFTETDPGRRQDVIQADEDARSRQANQDLRQADEEALLQQQDELREQDRLERIDEMKALQANAELQQAEEEQQQQALRRQLPQMPSRTPIVQYPASRGQRFTNRVRYQLPYLAGLRHTLPSYAAEAQREIQLAGIATYVPRRTRYLQAPTIHLAPPVVTQASRHSYLPPQQNRQTYYYDDVDKFAPYSAQPFGDDDDEKPEVHVHIQAEKRTIARKPSSEPSSKLIPNKRSMIKTPKSDRKNS